jgi:hypothetical protein
VCPGPGRSFGRVVGGGAGALGAPAAFWRACGGVVLSKAIGDHGQLPPIARHALGETMRLSTVTAQGGPVTTAEATERQLAACCAQKGIVEYCRRDALGLQSVSPQLVMTMTRPDGDARPGQRRKIDVILSRHDLRKRNHQR